MCLASFVLYIGFQDTGKWNKIFSISFCFLEEDHLELEYKQLEKIYFKKNQEIPHKLIKLLLLGVLCHQTPTNNSFS